MNIKKHTYIILSALAFTACSHDDNSAPTYTVGDADNAIVLSAGIAEGPSSVSSRGAEDHHTTPGHKTFAANTKLRLRVDGTWTGKANGSAPHGTISGGTVSQTTTATITGADSKHNSLSMSPQLYWDDYGTADPANAGEGKGRKKGLTIYAAAVDGVTTAPTVSNWTELSWNVGTAGTGGIVDQSNATNYWKAKDLLISNNVKDGNDGTLKFDALYPTKLSTASDLLEFTHAMSKITVRLIAGEGFPATGVGATATKFATAPEVILTSNEGTSTTNPEWSNTACNVDVTTGGISSTATPAKIKMHTAKTDDSQYTVIYDALVVPGSCFGATDAATIARINADDNIYYVTAKEIRTKMHSINGSTDFKTESGKNYIITVTVKKTKIEVTATIKDWDDITAETDEPVINVTTAITGTSQKDDAFTSFDFYLSDNSASSPATSYEKKGTPTGTKTDGTQAWTFTSPLYWPSHSTHYHMRGVYPSGTTVTNGKIAVTNGDYSSATFPSNLLVGAPEFTDANKYCDNPDHTSVDMSANGVCARKANINLMFSYMMSQIEVRLSTTTGTDKVNLTNAKVEIINGYTAGNIDIHTKTAAISGTKNDFEVKHISGENDNYRHSIIVPQALSNGTGDNADLKFKITITNSDSSTDTYFATIKDIKVTESGEDTSKSITAWDPGKHYIYTFNMRKTEITVTATLTNWIPVEASENVWF